MVAGLVLLFGYVTLVWLVFFKFRWLKFSIAWGVVSAFVGLHLLIIFMIGLRFVTPLATEARSFSTRSSSCRGCPSRRWSPRSWWSRTSRSRRPAAVSVRSPSL